MIWHFQSRLHLDKGLGIFAKEVLDLLITKISQLLHIYPLKREVIRVVFAIHVKPLFDNLGPL